MSRMKPLAEDQRLSAFERLAYSVLEGLYPAASTGLLEHICKAVTEKYQEVLYRQYRGVQYKSASQSQPESRSSPWAMEQRLPHHILASPAPGSLAKKSGDQSLESTNKKDPDSTLNLPSLRSSAFSEGAFKSHYESSNFPSQANPRPVQSIATKHTGYTPTQEIPEGAKYADCQWCLGNYPAEVFETPTLWRHVIHTGVVQSKCLLR